MKVRVNTYLNVRTGTPEILPYNNPYNAFYNPEDVVEIVETVIGEEYKGNKVWYKLENGIFVWSGGVDIDGLRVPGSLNLFTSQQTTEVQQFEPLKMSWGHKLYNIPFIWKELGTKGHGVTVAVIDTGIDNMHPDLSSNIHPLSKSLISKSTEIFDSDGHGTNMAGIIGACGKSKVYGVAPNVKLLIVKATTQTARADIQKFIEGINYVTSIPEVDIVSISYSFVSGKNNIERLEQLKMFHLSIKNCLLSNKIVVAAIGDNHISIPDRDTFPACYEIPESINLLSVGAFDQNNRICNFSNYNKHLSFLAPGDDQILTTGLIGTSVMGGKTSIATAFAVGCLALMVSYLKNESVTKINPVEVLLNTCDDIGSTIGFDIQSGNGLLNFRNAINKIKIK